MGKQEQMAKLIRTKEALAKKYERLARSSKSKPKRQTLYRHAESYRRQVKQLSGQS